MLMYLIQELKVRKEVIVFYAYKHRHQIVFMLINCIEYQINNIVLPEYIYIYIYMCVYCAADGVYSEVRIPHMEGGTPADNVYANTGRKPVNITFN